MKRLLILSILLLPLVAFSQKTYEYLSISQSYKILAIAIGEETYEEIKLKDVQSWDFRPLFNKVQHYESEGWVVFSTNQHSVHGQSLGVLPSLNFILRREK